MLAQSFLESRSESLISGARLLLASALLLALGQSGRHPGVLLPLTLYLLCALLLPTVLPRLAISGLRAQATLDGLDLVAFALLSWRSAGDPRVCLPLLAFLLFAGALRWRWRVVSASQGRFGRDMCRIAAWPHAPLDGDALPAHLLEHAGEVLEAPRLLLAWEELDEPWLHLAHASTRPGGAVETSREAPPAYLPLVAEPLIEASFLAAGPGGSSPGVWHVCEAGLRSWNGAAVNPDLQRRFAMDRLASWPFRGEAVTGRLFALDRGGLDRDYLVLGEVAARRIAAELDRFYLTQPLRSKAIVEERLRVACDLHDGILQSLAGTALQLEVLARQLEDTPGEACEQLKTIQRALAVDQRELRFFIEELKPASPRWAAQEADLGARLEELAERLRRRCGLAVDLDLEAMREGVSEGLSRQLYRLVREALFNAARHSGAASARVEVRRQDRGLEVNVTDDGRGFPFHGRFDHEELNRHRLGPVSLKERISALGGSLAIDTEPGRTRLEMRLPAVGASR